MWHLTTNLFPTQSLRTRNRRKSLTSEGNGDGDGDDSPPSKLPGQPWQFRVNDLFQLRTCHDFFFVDFFLQKIACFTWKWVLLLTVTTAWIHLSPCVPAFDHSRVSCEPFLRYTLRVLMWAPYMWYQNDKHFPLWAVVPGTTELISFAVSCSFLGEDDSMYMYHPFAYSVQQNVVRALKLIKHCYTVLLS